MYVQCHRGSLAHVALHLRDRHRKGGGLHTAYNTITLKEERQVQAQHWRHCSRYQQDVKHIFCHVL